VLEVTLAASEIVPLIVTGFGVTEVSVVVVAGNEETTTEPELVELEKTLSPL
jgi:hypothetical protein